MRVLEIRPEQIVCEVDGQIEIRPNSSYYTLHYFDYNQKRIAYTFSDDMYVMETFDQRIFNCWCKGERFQFRQDLSEELAKAIQEHREFTLTKNYEELFEKAKSETVYWDVINYYLNNMENVVQVKGGWIIHDHFKIDWHGNAWTNRKNFKSPPNGPNDGDWESLCIVMQGNHDYTNLINDVGDLVKVNPLTMTIISKVMFLVNPNLDDKTFMNQIQDEIKEKLKSIIQ